MATQMAMLQTNALIHPVSSTLVHHRQALRPKAHGKQLIQRKHDILALLVIHKNRHLRLSIPVSNAPLWISLPSNTYLAKLSNELSAHATRTSRRADICSHCQRSDVASSCSLDYGCAQGCSLGAGPDGVCSILDVCAADHLATLQQQRGSDSEL